MGRKVIAFWLSLTMILSLIVVLDVILDFNPPVKGGIIRYVNETGTGGAFTSIQDAINASSDGDTVYVYSGTYYENIVVNRTINLTGEDKNTTIIDGGGSNNLIYIESDWVNVSGFSIINGYFGIELQSSSNSRIENNNVSFNLYGISLFYSDRNNITNNEMYDNGIYICGNQLEQWNTHEIDTTNIVNEKPVYYWKNRAVGKVPSEAGQIILANCTDIIIENQDITNCTTGILLAFSSNNKITCNNASNNIDGISLLYSDKNNITSNNASSNSFGIMVSYSNGNNITSNLVSNNYDGIYLPESDRNNITNNTILNNTEGMYLFFSNENEISYNYLSLNRLHGISLYESDVNNITNNTIFKNYYGIRLFYCGWNKIINNTITLSKWYGIKLTYALNAMDNIIYHNNFVSNTYQAYDDDIQFRNQWDNGYPSGGNYWSDYTGVDHYKGPDQDINGSDGIGDSPYGIATDSWDLYPLMTPFPGNNTYLRQGWNLISIPLIQSDTSISKALESIQGEYDAVQCFDVTDNEDHWKHYHISKPSYLDDLSDVNPKMGFWIHITNLGGTIFRYAGTQPTVNQTITLNPGWNLVGYPSLKSYNRTKGLNNLTFGAHIDAIWTYNAATQKWKKIEQSDYFELGRGYWIHAITKCEWEVPL